MPKSVGILNFVNDSLTNYIALNIKFISALGIMGLLSVLAITHLYDVNTQIMPDREPRRM